MAASPMLPINVKFEMPEPAIGKGQACRLHISGDFTFIGKCAAAHLPINSIR